MQALQNRSDGHPGPQLAQYVGDCDVSEAKDFKEEEPIFVFFSDVPARLGPKTAA
jgi:hypothetical protein